MLNPGVGYVGACPTDRALAAETPPDLIDRDVVEIAGRIVLREVESRREGADPPAEDRDLGLRGAAVHRASSSSCERQRSKQISSQIERAEPARVRQAKEILALHDRRRTANRP